MWCDVDEGRDTRNTSQGGKNAKTAIRRYIHSSTTQLQYSTGIRTVAKGRRGACVSPHIDSMASHASSTCDGILRPTARVIFQNLQARAALNGTEGELLSYVEASGRWAVRVIVDAECIKVKAANLRLVPPLRERLSPSEIDLILRHCDVASMRTLRAVDCTFMSSVARVGNSLSWLRRNDNEQLTSWRIASNMCSQGGVYGFFTLNQGQTLKTYLADCNSGTNRISSSGARVSRSASGRLVAHLASTPSASSSPAVVANSSSASKQGGAAAAIDLWDAVSGLRLGKASFEYPVGGIALSADGTRLALWPTETPTTRVSEGSEACIDGLQQSAAGSDRVGPSVRIYRVQSALGLASPSGASAGSGAHGEVNMLKGIGEADAFALECSLPPPTTGGRLLAMAWASEGELSPPVAGCDGVDGVGARGRSYLLCSYAASSRTVSDGLRVHVLDGDRGGGAAVTAATLSDVHISWSGGSGLEHGQCDVVAGRLDTSFGRLPTRPASLGIRPGCIEAAGIEARGTEAEASCQQSHTTSRLLFAGAVAGNGLVLLLLQGARAPSQGGVRVTDGIHGQGQGQAALVASWLKTRHASGMTALALLAGGGGARIACAGADQMLSIWSVDTGACLATLDYRKRLAAMPWAAAPWRFEAEPFKLGEGHAGSDGNEAERGLTDAQAGGHGHGRRIQPWEETDPDGGAPPELSDLSLEEPRLAERSAQDAAKATEASHPPNVSAAEASPSATCNLAHELLSLDASGGSMVVSGDSAGCVCIWDVGGVTETEPGELSKTGASVANAVTNQSAAGASELQLVAVLPPPDLEEQPANEAGAIRGVAITQTGGAAVAGGGVVYATSRGELTKFVPVGASSLARLSESGARESIFQDSLLAGLHQGLGDAATEGQLV